LQESNLLVGKGADFLPVNNQRAEKGMSVAEGYGEKRTNASDFKSFASLGIVPISLGLADIEDVHDALSARQLP
jgi:hypothetical protein